MTRTITTFGCLAVLAAAARVPAQLQWTRVDTAVPGAIAGEQIVYDSSRDRVVLFGGTAQPIDTPYHLLEWDGAQWLPVAAIGLQPSGRSGAAMTYDRQRARTVVFGGVCIGNCSGGAGPFVLDETWEYDGFWQQRSPAHAPSPRWGAAMAYDAARGLVIMFGGRDSASALIAETWVYDGIDWMQRLPLHQPAANGPMAYDPDALAVTLVAAAQTWFWNGVDWVAANAATPQFGEALAWDAARRRLVLYSPSYAHTWEWNGTAWLQRTETSPSPDVSFAMTYDELRRRILWVTTRDLGTPTYRDTYACAPLHGATFQTYGSRCISATSSPDLRARGGSLPWLGAAFDVEVAGVSTDSPGALIAFGFDVAPIDLAPLGWPGCVQYVATDVIETMAVGNGVASWSAVVPAQPVLLGAVFHLQSLVLDNHAIGGAVTSNAAVASIGAR